MRETVIIGGKDYTETDPTARLIFDRMPDESISRTTINVVLKALLEIEKEYNEDPLAWCEAHCPTRRMLDFDNRLTRFLRWENA